MTDREKQIEEMAKEVLSIKVQCKGQECNKHIPCTTCYAEHLYNAGYRKMDDTIVVLEPADITPEELARIMAEAHISAISLPDVPEIIDIEATCRENIKQVFEELNNYPYLERRQIRDFAKKYGVQLDDTP